MKEELAGAKTGGKKKMERRNATEDGKGRNYMSEKWHDGINPGSSGIWTGILLLLIGSDYFLVKIKYLPEWMWSWNSAFNRAWVFSLAFGTILEGRPGLF